MSIASFFESNKKSFAGQFVAVALGAAAVLAPINQAFAVTAKFCADKWVGDINGAVSCMSTNIVARNTLPKKGDSTPPFTINDPALPAEAQGSWVCVSQGRSTSLDRPKVNQRLCHHAR